MNDSMNDDSTVIDEAYRLSEQRLQSQLQAALAADQRAMSAAGMLVAAAAVITALAEHAASSWSMLVGAVGLSVAALLAWYSARPQNFYMPGALFGDLAEDIERKATLSQVKRELGAFNDKHAGKNSEAMDRSANQMALAFLLAVFSVIFVVTAQGVAMNCDACAVAKNASDE